MGTKKGKPLVWHDVVVLSAADVYVGIAKDRVGRMEEQDKQDGR